MTALQRLSLPRSRLRGSALAALAGAQLARLTALKLDGNSFECADAGCALSAAPCAAGLRRLSLAACGRVCGSPEFLAFLARDDLTIADLDLSCTGLDERVFTTLRRAGWAHHLTRVRLGHCAGLGAGLRAEGGGPASYKAWEDLAAAPLASVRALDLSPGPGVGALPAAAAACISRAPWLRGPEALDTKGWVLDDLRALAPLGARKNTPAAQVHVCRDKQKLGSCWRQLVHIDVIR